MMDLYVYYRVKRENAAQLQPRVSSMQAALAAQHGITTGLKRRPEEKNGEQTWMEVYGATAEGFAGALDEAVQAAGLSELTSGPRHTEIFVDIACA